ncbi:unnamed protein product [Camellia sinensis]
MSYYNQQHYTSQGEAKDAYLTPGYEPQQAYPTPAQSYPPQGYLLSSSTPSLLPTNSPAVVPPKVALKDE